MSLEKCLPRLRLRLEQDLEEIELTQTKSIGYRYKSHGKNLYPRRQR